MISRTQSRRRLLTRISTALAGSAFVSALPPTIADGWAIKFTLALLPQGSSLYVYVARAKGMIDLDSSRGFGSVAAAQSIAGDQFGFGIVREMPNGDHLCHGDFHPRDVLGEASQPIVIDWPNACCGDPAANVRRSYLILKLHADEVAESYLDAYCQVVRVRRQIILDWLPYIPAARLAEDAPGEQRTLLEFIRAAPSGDNPGNPCSMD